LEKLNENSKNTSGASSAERKSTLAELLEGYDGPVKIGAKNGSGFIFCGPLKDLDPEDVNNELIGAAADGIKYQDEQLDIIRRNGANLSAFFDKMISDAKLENKKELPPFHIGDYITYLEKRVEKMAYHYAQAEELRDYIRKLKPFMKREVLDMYESIDPDDPNTMIVIVEGVERAEAWTTGEYKSDAFAARRNKKILQGIRYRKEVLGDGDGSGSAGSDRTVRDGGRRRRVDP
jgi:hypothetical protein